MNDVAFAMLIGTISGSAAVLLISGLVGLKNIISNDHRRNK